MIEQLTRPSLDQTDVQREKGAEQQPDKGDCCFSKLLPNSGSIR